MNEKKNHYFFLVKSNHRFLWGGGGFVIWIVSEREAHSLPSWTVERHRACSGTPSPVGRTGEGRNMTWLLAGAGGSARASAELTDSA